MENNASVMLIWVHTDTVYTSAGSCQFWNRTLIISTRRTWEVSSSFNVSSAIVGFLHSASAASPFSAPSRSWSHDDTRLFREHMHLSITGYKFPSVRPLLSLLWAFCLISHPSPIIVFLQHEFLDTGRVWVTGTTPQIPHLSLFPYVLSMGLVLPCGSAIFSKFWFKVGNKHMLTFSLIICRPCQCLAALVQVQ